MQVQVDYSDLMHLWWIYCFAFQPQPHSFSWVIPTWVISKHHRASYCTVNTSFQKLWLKLNTCISVRLVKDWDQGSVNEKLLLLNLDWLYTQCSTNRLRYQIPRRTVVILFASDELYPTRWALFLLPHRYKHIKYSNLVYPLYGPLWEWYYEIRAIGSYLRT